MAANVRHCHYTLAELRLVGDAPADMLPASRRSRELTTDDIAELTGDSLWTVQRRVKGWYAQQHVDPTLPRVTRERGEGEGRWRYLVDADSYDRHCERGVAPVAFKLPAPASDAAVARGCVCVAMETGAAAGAFVVRGCPVHRVMWEG